MKTHTKTTVYDWPTRIFHWLFAFFFLAAFVIAQTVDDESSLFSLHIMAGLTVGFLLLLRLIWGVAGTKYARFSSFKLNPRELIQYLKDALFSKTKNYPGHNPASSYAAVIMFVSAAGLAVTGIMMTGGGESDFTEELHELLANVFLITVVLHVGGILFHHVKHRDSLWSSMVDGKKSAISQEAGIRSSKGFAGIVFFILTLVWTGYLYSNYDSTTQRLDLFGTELQIGEAEHESDTGVEAGDHESEEEEEDDDDH